MSGVGATIGTMKTITIDKAEVERLLARTLTDEEWDKVYETLPFGLQEFLIDEVNYILE